MLSKAQALPPSEHDEHNHHTNGAEGFSKRFWMLTLGCIGVVYGDIGTSPLYAFREAASKVHGADGIKPEEIYGILSLIIWALIINVTLKYVMFLLRVDNRGEGGNLSLMALARKGAGKWAGVVFFMGIIGAALFAADASITPAISILSAVEGLKLISPQFESYVLPLTIVIIITLFMVQKGGTGKMSIVFGPITSIWFLVLGFIGIVHIVSYPTILQSINPVYGLAFLAHHGQASLLVLGSVFLAVTGVEALYVDLGHFGRRPIQTAWLSLVFPCLVLNYMGQAALVLQHPETIENTFFLMFPEWALLPIVLLATAATIIASQAVITGAYSLAQQAIQLGLLPRMEIRHTSAETEGQIYMPKINNLLMISVLFLCLMFKSSSALASAYGIAVCGTLIVTSIMAFIVIWKVWKKPLIVAMLAIIPFLFIESVFMSSNLLKLFDGGYVPLIFAAFFLLVMTVWVKGTRYLYGKTREASVPLTDLMETLEQKQLARVSGTAIFLTSDPQSAPVALMHNLQHNKVLHERNIILSIVNTHTPKVPDAQRLVVEPMCSFMTRAILSFGYMETPDVPKALALAKAQGLNLDLESVSYFLGRRSIIADPYRGLPLWQDYIYISMVKASANATDFYRLPYNQVVEMGTQIAV